METFINNLPNMTIQPITVHNNHGYYSLTPQGWTTGARIFNPRPIHPITVGLICEMKQSVWTQIKPMFNESQFNHDRFETAEGGSGTKPRGLGFELIQGNETEVMELRIDSDANVKVLIGTHGGTDLYRALVAAGIDLSCPKLIDFSNMVMSDSVFSDRFRFIELDQSPPILTR